MSEQDSQKPTLPAEAWRQMKELLDKEMPANRNNRRKYGILLLLLLIGGCGIYNLFNTSTSDPGKAESVVTNVQQRNNAERSTQTPGERQKPRAPSAGADNEIVVNRGEQPVPGIQGAEAGTSGNNSKLTTNKPVAVERESVAATAKPHDHFAGAKQKRGSQKLKYGDVTDGHEETLAKNHAVEKIAATSVANTGKNNLAGKSVLAQSTAKPTIQGGQPAETKDAGKEVLAKAPVKDKAATTPVAETRKDSSAAKPVAGQNIADAKKPPVKTPAARRRNSFNYGLEWNLPLPFENNTVFTEVNGQNRPLIALIPSLWLSRELSGKSSLQFSFDPYAQYLLNRRSVLQTAEYSIGAVGESNINQPPQATRLAQTFTLYKVTGMEATLQYAHSLTRRWDVALGLSNMWTTTALFKETIVRNNSQTVKDSLFGVIKTEKNWSYVKNSFISGRINLAYTINHYQAGIAFTKPLTAVYNVPSSGRYPVNMLVFFRWRMK